MFKVIVLIAVLAVLCSTAVSAQVGNVTLELMTSPPEGWSPADVSIKDIDITHGGPWTFAPSGGVTPYRVHIGIPGGIWDLHITTSPPGDPIAVTQNLFANQSPDGAQVDLWGTHLPFCTYFYLTNDCSIEITPTPEPGSLMVLGSGLAALAGMALRRRR